MSMSWFSRNKDYLYTIQSDPFYYYTGVTSDGFQALLVLYYPSVITLLFDSDGNLVEVSETPLSESMQREAERYGFYDTFLQEGAERKILWHIEQRGFKQEPIKVKRFFLPQYHIGIEDFPEGFREILLQPSHYSTEDLLLAENASNRWLSEGMFELWLNPDSYRWIKGGGEIESS